MPPVRAEDDGADVAHVQVQRPTPSTPAPNSSSSLGHRRGQALDVGDCPITGVGDGAHLFPRGLARLVISTYLTRDP